MYIQYSGDWLKYLIDVIITYNGKYNFLYLYYFIAIILVLMIFLKKSINKLQLALPWLLGLLVICNPLFVWLMYKANIVSTGRFYRFFWIFPIGLVIAYFVILIIDKVKHKYIKCIVFLICILIIIKSGSVNESLSSYQVAQNIYKIPNCIIETSTIIHNDAEEDKDIRVYYDDYFLVNYRMYDPSIISVRDRGELYPPVTDGAIRVSIEENYYEYIMKYVVIFGKANEIPVESFRDAVNESNIDYLIIKSSFCSEDYATNAGLSLIGTTGDYNVYSTEEK